MHGKLKNTLKLWSESPKEKNLRKWEDNTNICLKITAFDRVWAEFIGPVISPEDDS
jgi:hypothetical protein